MRSNYSSNLQSILKIRVLFIALLITLLTTFTLTFICYTGNCNYAKDAISDAGALRSNCDGGNCVSQVIFSTGMMISAFIIVFMSRAFQRLAFLHRRVWVVNCLRLASIGFALIIMPTDGIRWIHFLGVILGVGGLWLMTLLLLWEVKEEIGTKRYWLLHLVIDLGVMGYFSESLMSMGESTYMQKFGFAILAVVSFLSLNELIRTRKRSLRKQRDRADPVN